MEDPQDKFARLNKVDRKDMLRQALRIARKLRRLADLPAWCAIGEICGVGATEATFIGLELKIDPSAKLCDALDHYDGIKKRKKKPA